MQIQCWNCRVEYVYKGDSEKLPEMDCPNCHVNFRPPPTAENTISEQPIMYCKFQQIELLANILGWPVEAVPLINQAAS